MDIELDIKDLENLREELENLDFKYGEPYSDQLERDSSYVSVASSYGKASSKPSFAIF